MMSRAECLARAVEMEGKMAETPDRVAHEEYAQLAAQSRILAEIAAHDEANALVGAT